LILSDSFDEFVSKIIRIVIIIRSDDTEFQNEKRLLSDTFWWSSMCCYSFIPNLFVKSEQMLKE